MEVHIKPETESRLTELASKSGRAIDDLVEDALAGYLTEVAEVREMLDGRYAGLERNTEASRGTSRTAGTAEQVPKWLQVLKTGTEILAYIFAFIFFLYKSYEAYLTTNLSVKEPPSRAVFRFSRG